MKEPLSASSYLWNLSKPNLPLFYIIYFRVSKISAKNAAKIIFTGREKPPSRFSLYLIFT